MSPSNVEVAHALIELWNEGVREIPAEYVDPAVELESPFSRIAGEPYRGHAGLEQWARDLDEQFSRWRVHPEELRAVGDAVLLLGRVSGRGRASGVELDQPFAAIIDFRRDHRICRVRIYWQPDEAREALGLSALAVSTQPARAVARWPHVRVSPSRLLGKP